MDAMGTLIREIGGEIDALEEGAYGEVILDADACRWPIDDEFLRAPQPDVLIEPVDPEQFWGIVEDLAAERGLNGLYIPMRSPGQVILFRRNLRRTFWALIRRIQPRMTYLTKSDLRAGADLVVMNTYHHELFHFYSDVLRQLFGANFDPLLDEALAVAWARRAVIRERGKWQSKIGRMNGLLYRLLMEEAFAYTSPGYRDWPLYADDARFQAALLDYLDPPGLGRLQPNGVDLGPMLVGAIEGISGGYVEQMI